MNNDLYAQGEEVLRVYLESWYRNKAATNGSPAKMKPAAALQTMDPQEVGALARQYQDAEHANGHEISATDAVAYVLAGTPEGYLTNRSSTRQRGSRHAIEGRFHRICHHTYEGV